MGNNKARFRKHCQTPMLVKPGCMVEFSWLLKKQGFQKQSKLLLNTPVITSLEEQQVLQLFMHQNTNLRTQETE